MQFRRSGQRAERRRRVLIDETVTAPVAAQQAPAGAGAESATPDPAELRNYAEAALAIHQPRVTDLIPTRRWTLVVLLLTACSLHHRNVEPDEWTHPVTVVAAVLGGLALLIGITVLVGIRLPLIANERTAFVVLAVTMLAKVVLARLHHTWLAGLAR